MPQSVAKVARRKAAKAGRATTNPASTSHARLADFNILQRQNRRWLQYHDRLGGINAGARADMLRYLRMSKAEIARPPRAREGLRLCGAAAALLVPIERERKEARERAGTTGRVGDWWLEKEEEEKKKEENDYDDDNEYGGVPFSGFDSPAMLSPVLAPATGEKEEVPGFDSLAL